MVNEKLGQVIVMLNLVFFILRVCLLFGLFCLVTIDWDSQAEMNRGPSDPVPTAEEITHGRLQVWGEAMVWVLDKGDADLEKYASLDEVLSGWKNKELIDPGLIPDLEKDAWGRTFDWYAAHEDGILVVCVSSAGANGVGDEGEGDDLWVRVTKPKDRPSEVELKPLPK
jgi:hypothetical protein